MGHLNPLRSRFVLLYAPPMARDFITLSDMPQAVLGDVEVLKREHGGDVKMP
jgi:hypothetical protein